MGTELLAQAANIKMAHIAYRGMAPAFSWSKLIQDALIVID